MEVCVGAGVEVGGVKVEAGLVGELVPWMYTSSYTQLSDVVGGYVNIAY